MRLLLPILVACADPAPGSGAPPTGEAARLDTADPFAGLPSAAEPGWAPETVETHLNTALAGGIPHPMGYRAAFSEAMSHAGGGCPRYEDPAVTSGLGTWFAEDCTAGGWTFHGLSVFFEEHTDARWDFGGIASFEIADAAGDVFIGGGSFAHERVVSDDGTVTLDDHLGGTYRAPWADGWMASGVDVGIWITGTRTVDATVTTVDGGLQGAEGAVYLDHVTRDPAVCGGVVQGEVRLRDPEGGWYLVTLSDCSGCGDVVWGGEAVGEACPGEVLARAFDELEAAEWAP